MHGGSDTDSAGRRMCISVGEYILGPSHGSRKREEDNVHSHNSPIQLAELHRRDLDVEVARDRLARQARAARSGPFAHGATGSSRLTPIRAFAGYALGPLHFAASGPSRPRQASTMLRASR